MLHRLRSLMPFARYEVAGESMTPAVAPGERVLGKSGLHRLETFRRALEVNLVGTFNVLRLAAHARA